MSYWRERAAEAIASVIASASVDLKNLSLADKRKLKGAIDASYPFGVRKIILTKFGLMRGAKLSMSLD